MIFNIGGLSRDTHGWTFEPDFSGDAAARCVDRAPGDPNLRPRATKAQSRGNKGQNGPRLQYTKGVQPLPLSPPAPLCDIPSGCCFFTGPWTITCSSLRMLRRVAAFCRPLRLVLLLVSFPQCAGAVLDVAGCAVCTSAAPSCWCIGVVLVVAGVV